MASHAVVPHETTTIESRGKGRRLCGGVENPLHQLSHDVVTEILEKLPVKSILRFKAVCKSWRDTIESAGFARRQLQYSEWRLSQSSNKTEHGQRIFMQGRSTGDHYSVSSFYDVSLTSIRTLQPPLKMSQQKDLVQVYSCEGVFLLVEDPTRIMFLWNPVTEKFREIPYPGLSPASCYSLHGFGYDSATQDYRIVRIDPNFETHQLEVRVFASKTNSWTTARNHPTRYQIYPDQTESNAFIHGGIHFMAYDSLEDKRVILCLSTLDGEVIGEFVPPPPARSPRCCCVDYPGDSFVTMVRAGRLCLQGSFAGEDWLTKWRFEVWSMEEYGDSKSWTPILSVSRALSDHGYVPLGLMQNRDVLVRMGNDVYLHDRKRKRYINGIKKFQPGIIRYSFWVVHSYVESLVSP